jgi:hypothetical protein
MRRLCTRSERRDQAIILSFRHLDGTTGNERLTTESQFALFGQTRRCIGARLPGQTTLTACPERALLQRGSQCERCVARAMILPCLRCTGERCSNVARRARCVQPDNHIVYLAAHAPGLFKVGVARAERRQQRLLEQGAACAYVIARADGREARFLETQIRRLGIRDRLTPSERLAASTTQHDPSLLLSELSNTAEALRRRLPGDWLPEPEQVVLPPLPVLPRIPRLLSTASLHLHGRITAILGTLIVVEADTGELAAVETTALPGLVVTPAQAANEAQLALAV